MVHYPINKTFQVKISPFLFKLNIKNKKGLEKIIKIEEQKSS